MKLFCDVADAAWPASEPAAALPSTKEPLWIALASKVVPVAPLPPALLLLSVVALPPLFFCAYTTALKATTPAILEKSILEICRGILGSWREEGRTGEVESFKN